MPGFTLVPPLTIRTDLERKWRDVSTGWRKFSSSIDQACSNSMQAPHKRMGGQTYCWQPSPLAPGRYHHPSWCPLSLSPTFTSSACTNSSSIHQNTLAGPTAKRFSSHLLCGGAPGKMETWLEEAPTHLQVQPDLVQGWPRQRHLGRR